jgi:hypothetical protein
MSEPIQNPYDPPRAALEVEARGPLAEGACPRCRRAQVTRPSFTWWGGALGPKLLHHAVCRACGFGFNARTGRSNGSAITVYVVASFALAALVLYVVAR